MKDGMYIAECIDLPGCFVEGKNLFDLKNQIKEKMKNTLNRPILDSDIYPVYTGVQAQVV